MQVEVEVEVDGRRSSIFMSLRDFTHTAPFARHSSYVHVAASSGITRRQAEVLLVDSTGSRPTPCRRAGRLRSCRADAAERSRHVHVDESGRKTLRRRPHRPTNLVGRASTSGTARPESGGGCGSASGRALCCGCCGALCSASSRGCWWGEEERGRVRPSSRHRPPRCLPPSIGPLPAAPLRSSPSPHPPRGPCDERERERVSGVVRSGGGGGDVQGCALANSRVLGCGDGAAAGEICCGLQSD